MTSERLEEAGGASRAAHGPGGRLWEAAASTYDRSAISSEHPPHLELGGVSDLEAGMTAEVAKELGVAKTALAITDPAFQPERW